MGIRLEAWREVLKHYKAVFKASWDHRHEMEPRKLLSHEAQFLPAALELQETPPPPAPRVAMWMIISFAMIAFFWSIFGKVDVVATAQGKIVPSARSKVIQSLEPAYVKAIHVNEGQAVKTGQVLIELDSSQVLADATRLQNDLALARLQVARSQAVLDSIAADKEVLPIRPQGVTDRDYNEAVQHFRGQYGEFAARVSRMEADLERSIADQASVEATVKKLERTLPLTRSKVKDLRELAVEQFIPRHQLEEAEQDLFAQEGDLRIQRERLKQSEATVQTSKRQLVEVTAEMRRMQLDAITDARQKEIGSLQELNKATTRSQQMRLVAPVDGVVQQLEVHTIGGVVQSAQQLMVIVPHGDSLEVEAFIENKDVGFVREGQSAEIKVESFPYTKYGIVPGEVLSVSNDSIPDEKRGYIYKTMIRMGKSTMIVEGKEVHLSPGMNVTAEIKTGQRRVIEFFLTPLVAGLNHAISVR